MTIDNLSDDLLLEIWSRFPSKMAVRCKSISKRFSALISQPQFIARSIFHSHTLFQQMKEEEHDKDWYLNFVSKRKLFILFPPNIYLSIPPNQNQLSLSFLGRKFDPKLDDETKKSFRYSRIIGCSNGLLLCKKTASGRVYIVCNPITKGWIKLPLPPPPLTDHNRRDRVFEGFVCEPYYHVDGNKVTFNRHRFRVVRIPFFEGTVTEFLSGITKYEFEVVVFASETGQWSTKLVSCPNGFTQATVMVPAVAHEGRLYFIGKKSLLVYDPFNNDKLCHTIDYPNYLYVRYIPFKGHIGVCCGKIRISSISISVPNSPLSVSVCELKEDSSWHLLHVTRLPRLELGNSVRSELGAAEAVDVVGMGVHVRAFHPNHGDIVFFQYAHRIFYGNLKTNHFETVGYGIHGFQSLQIISLDLPLWPTPLPSIA